MSVARADAPGIPATDGPGAGPGAALTARERVLLWSPWAALGMSAVAASGLAGWLCLSLIDARAAASSQERRLTLSLATMPPVPGSGPTAGPVWRDPQSAVAAMADAVALLLVDASHLLEHIETLAADSGVTLLQFVPEPAKGTAADGLPVFKLQIRAPGSRLEPFLAGLGDPGPAIELTSLRLSADRASDEVFGELSLRLHDEASLTRHSTLSAPPGASHPADPDRSEWLMTGLFGPAAPPSKAPGSDSTGGRVLAHPSPSETRADPFAGLRLAGLLSQGDRVAALIEIPGEGLVLLRPSERLGQTGLRLAGTGSGRVVVAAGAGQQRILELDARPVASQ